MQYLEYLAAVAVLCFHGNYINLLIADKFKIPYFLS